ncbi:hypothetical protein PUN28_006387 [Cardiocondyla obscurior]|uniref:Uncharacterized protein n=1 Tax=Cardiocondyla obscurior TaxID=286306 RepID=A0AAW2GD78_9HYME
MWARSEGSTLGRLRDSLISRICVARISTGRPSHQRNGVPASLSETRREIKKKNRTPRIFNFLEGSRAKSRYSVISMPSFYF